MSLSLSDLINQSLDKIKKGITKKQFELKQLIDETLQIKDFYDANHLLKVYQQCIESKQAKLIELALFDIKNIVDQGYLAGEQIIGEKRAIEIALDLVMQTQLEKEETVQIHMIKAIQAIMTNKKHHIYGESVTRVFSLLINLHSVSKIVAIINASKEACQKIVSTYFARLEDYGILAEDEYQLAIQQQGNSGQLVLGKCKALVNAEQYMKSLMTSMVDEVQIYYERCQIYEKQLEDSNKSKVIDITLHEPSLRNVTMDNNQIQINIINELNIKNGKFGWCTVCRRQASQYCKDTKVPICSKECKFIHLNQMFNFSQSHSHSTFSEQYVKDAYEILEMLCQLSQRDPQNPQLAQMIIKCKVLSLELIYEALAQSDTTILQHKPKLISILKEQLLESLLKNSLSAEKQLLILTLNIFIQLIWRVRSHLKKELEALIENVYFKFLESSNSSFDHKQYTLKVFNKILTRPKVVIEIFVNYDCSVGQNNLLKKILDMQCRIIQGRYSKQEFQASISQNQEIYLKSLCLDNYCGYVRSLKEYCEQYEDSQTVVQIQSFDEQEDAIIQQQQLSQDPLEKQKQMKLEMNKAVQKFNFKPEHCVKHLIAVQYMENRDPKLFAQFLWENRDLNKDKLGELFGGSNEFDQKVFSLYVDFMNFKGLQVDEGLRYMLEFFTLPGESQQIDRIMEKFASKFCIDNPGIYQSASAAYTLSYLLMMLQTDLHNEKNLDKMTLAQFTNLAKGINDGENLPQEMLQGFYLRIQKTPLALHAKEQARRALEQANQVDQRKRHAMLAKEAEDSLKKWFKEHPNSDAFCYVNSIEHMKSLLQQTWSVIFASISVFLEQSEDQQQILLCFETIQAFIQLMGRFDLDEEKDTFISFLYRYCTNIPSNYKQILGVQTLIKVILQSGQYLRKSWKVALQLISRLEQLHQVVKKIKVDSPYKENYNQEDIISIERLFQQIQYDQIDKIFNSSINLDSNSILEFIRALCELSKEEIKYNRLFLLSRVIDVAEFNMNRIKIIWSRMWEIMREHFLEVGCLKNVDVAIYAIDQLKQLSCKFLQQPELTNYYFQKEFLLPFEQIFSHTQAQQQNKIQLREFLLSCMCMITNICFNSIKSGWKIIMSIVNQALQDDQQQLVRLCVQITDKIMEDVSNQQVYSEIYMELTQALIKLTKNKDVNIVSNSIKQLKILVDHIVQIKRDDNKYLDQLWIPVLSALSVLYSDERGVVQQQSVNTLFELLKVHGEQQSNEFWKIILRGVIRPLFDEIQISKLQFAKQSQSKQQVIQNCKMTFYLFTDLVVLYIQQMQPCLNDLIDIYIQLVLQTQDFLSTLCLDSLKTIVKQGGQSFTEENWTVVIQQIQHLLQQCSPNELFEAYNLDEDFQKPLNELLKEEIRPKKFSFKINAYECTSKQSIQQKCLEILEVQAIQFNKQISEQHRLQILAIFSEQYQKCKIFNTHLYMRYFLEQWAMQWNKVNNGPEDFDDLSDNQNATKQLSFINQEFISATVIIQLTANPLEFIEQLIQRFSDAYNGFQQPVHKPETLNGSLEQRRYSESQTIISMSQILFMESVFPILKANLQWKIVSKWLIQLLKLGLNAQNVENREYNKILVNLLEEIINCENNQY
ncbi:unnamed protein product (macronuclear) [Paramecium tetraurelia]|uniref:Chromosome undetermined scaffold_18, whole genome shotgun sequence n=1 Tax=Paramecium tetraurelia TaxID=5888 RepID=Q9NJQ4_PARTE|nr:uncharacterized protein GSPATT00007457001 [Paramecium tetraurelia]AAF36486.2 SEC7-related protein [Paramecium tetraurelia]CAG38368.1 GGG2 [Paramecium tetraurelia]CAK70017.1 unnamed protein product [Paramecium tetraurelia]|eukprot:XP_001437414.1 hypothetical protein (macronuclear) [Paramecium tetraurelia strain d4-2]